MELPKPVEFASYQCTMVQRYQGANQPKGYLRAGTCAKGKLTSRGLLAIPAFTLSLSSVTDALNYNWDFAYAKEFLVALDELDMNKLKTIS